MEAELIKLGNWLTGRLAVGEAGRRRGDLKWTVEFAAIE